jgi:hypothetical protein
MPEQACVRRDFPASRRTRADPTRRTVDGMMLGERTGELARAFGLLPAPVSPLRR